MMEGAGAASTLGPRDACMGDSALSNRSGGAGDKNPGRGRVGRCFWDNTRTESARLPRSVTGHAPFFSSACHRGIDARFGVQD